MEPIRRPLRDAVTEKGQAALADAVFRASVHHYDGESERGVARYQRYKEGECYPSEPEVDLWLFPLTQHENHTWVTHKPRHKTVLVHEYVHTDRVMLPVVVVSDADRMEAAQECVALLLGQTEHGLPHLEAFAKHMAVRLTFHASGRVFKAVE